MAVTATIGTSYDLQNGFVWQDGALTISIRPCYWHVGGMQGTFAGAVLQPVNNGADNYVYIHVPNTTSTPVLVTNAAAWPVTPHLRLAVVTAAAGAITNIVDHRAFVTSGNIRSQYYHPGTVAESAGGTYEMNFVPWQSGCGLYTNSTVVPDTLYAVAFDFGRTAVIDRAYVNCTSVAGTTGNKKMSAFIYQAKGLNLLYPGSPLGVLGEVDVAVGLLQFPVAAPITLVPGFYFCVMTFDNTGTNPVFSAANRNYVKSLLGLDALAASFAAAPPHRISVGNAYSTVPPDPFPTGGTYDTGNGYTPIIGMRFSSIDS